MKLRRLCFYTCLLFCPRGVVSQHALQVVSQHAFQPVGAIPACLATGEVPAPGGSALGGVCSGGVCWGGACSQGGLLKGDV